MSLLADMGDFLVPGRTNLNIKIRLNIVIFTNYNIINSETMFTKAGPGCVADSSES